MARIRSMNQDQDEEEEFTWCRRAISEAIQGGRDSADNVCCVQLCVKFRNTRRRKVHFDARVPMADVQHLLVPIYAEDKDASVIIKGISLVGYESDTTVGSDDDNDEDDDDDEDAPQPEMVAQVNDDSDTDTIVL